MRTIGQKLAIARGALYSARILMEDLNIQSGDFTLEDINRAIDESAQLQEMPEDLLVFEREGAINAFERIMNLVPHDSPVYREAAEAHAWLVSVRNESTAK